MAGVFFMQSQLITRGLRETCGMHLLVQPATRAATIRCLASSAAQLQELVTVCFADPRLLLDNPKALAQTGWVTSLSVPRTFLPAFSKGHHELGDTDDPMNSWYFGKKGELFKYEFVGAHPVRSGLTSVLTQQVLTQIVQEQKSDLPKWDTFVQQIEDGTLALNSTGKLLFAGRLVDTSMAAVYKLMEGGRVEGVLISSQAAEDE